jgi:hypothetical protein
MNWQFIFIVGKNNTNLYQKIYLIILGDMSEHTGIISRSAGFVSLLFLKRKRKTYGISGRIFSLWGLVFAATTLLFFLSIQVWGTSKPLQHQFWNYALRFDTQWTEERSSSLWSFELGGVKICVVTPKRNPGLNYETDYTAAEPPPDFENRPGLD